MGVENFSWEWKLFCVGVEIFWEGVDLFGWVWKILGRCGIFLCGCGNKIAMQFAIWLGVEIFWVGVKIFGWVWKILGR